MLPRSKTPQRHDSKGSNGLSQRANTITRSVQPLARLRDLSGVSMSARPRSAERDGAEAPLPRHYLRQDLVVGARSSMAASSTVNWSLRNQAMDARITDLVAGFLLGGANALGATALAGAVLYGFGCIAAARCRRSRC
jgi:hypothetical protein